MTINEISEVIIKFFASCTSETEVENYNATILQLVEIARLTKVGELSKNNDL